MPKITDRVEPSVVTHGDAAPALRRSGLPPQLRVPVLLILSLGLRSTLLTTGFSFLENGLADISIPDQEGIEQAALRLAFNAAVVLLQWYANYDFLDLSSLTIIINAPWSYLLLTYYSVSPTVIAAYVAIDIVSVALPTFLLRPRSDVNNANVPLPNRYLLQDFSFQASTWGLAVAVYSVVIWAFQKTDILTIFLIKHFDIATVEAAHTETAASLIGKTFIAGYAVKNFLLNPSLGAQTASGAATPAGFDAAKASLPQTLEHNFWYWSKRTKALIRQTAVLTGFTVASTVYRTTTVMGSDLIGALGYSGFWVFANLVVAGWYGWVGNTEI